MIVATQTPTRSTTVRRTRRAGSTFERRFLSERFRGGAGMLEIAAQWRGNVVAVDSYREGKAPVTLGANDATYLVDGIPTPMTFAERTHRGWDVYVASNMGGFVVAPGKGGKSRRFSFDEAVAAGFAQRTPTGWRLHVTGDVRAKVEIGEQTFLVHYVSAPQLRLPLIARVGLAGLAIAVVASLALHFVFGALVASSTDRVDELALDRMAIDSRFGETLVEPLVEEQAEEEPEDVKDDIDADEADLTADAQEGNTDTDGDPGNMREGAATSDTLGGGKGGGDQVLDHNTVAVLSQLANGGPAAGDLSDSIYSWNTFDGSDAHKPGTYTLGPANTGKLGGRETGGGPDGLPTGGKGDPNGDGTHPIDTNTRKVLDDVKKTNRPTITPRRPTISGGLDKRIIRKVINQHKREIRTMYQKVLLSNKGAHGKIVVQFIIDPSGNVASAIVKSSTFTDKKLERMLVKALKSWRFPATKTGAMTKVSYPFVFELK